MCPIPLPPTHTSPYPCPNLPPLPPCPTLPQVILSLDAEARKLLAVLQRQVGGRCGGGAVVPTCVFVCVAVAG